jgi:hypothetical protein
MAAGCYAAMPQYGKGKLLLLGTKAPMTYGLRMPSGNFRPDPGLVAALVAIAGIGNLVALTVLGLLTRMPIWLSVLIVVLELLAPIVVYQFLKRRQER